MTTIAHSAAPGAARVEPAARTRIDAVDLLRGVIMIVMALDHTRDFFGNAAANPTDLATASAPLFLTRWITHFCAPVFFLLSGTGARLSRERRSTGALSRFLFTRGLWLVLLELTVFRFIMQFNVDYRVTILTVLWAFGWCMMLLALLVHLPPRIVGLIGVVMIAGHNALDGIRAASFGGMARLWNVLHAPGVLVANPRVLVIVGYVLVPWLGVMCAGYALGGLYTLDRDRRRAILLRLGLAATGAFVVLRAVNVYGDPARWAHQATPLYTVLSFLNTTKYPPSLLFLLMTLGPALLVLRAIDGRTPRLLAPALVIGRVPMFYFLLHFLVIHLLAVAASFVRFGAVHWMFESPTPDRYPITQPPGWPLPLPGVYLAWITVVLIAYPCCRWYAALKARRNDAWLSYL